MHNVTYGMTDIKKPAGWILNHITFCSIYPNLLLICSECRIEVPMHGRNFKVQKHENLRKLRQHFEY